VYFRVFRGLTPRFRAFIALHRSPVRAIDANHPGVIEVTDEDVRLPNPYLDRLGPYQGWQGHLLGPLSLDIHQRN